MKLGMCTLRISLRRRCFALSFGTLITKISLLQKSGFPRACLSHFIQDLTVLIECIRHSTSIKCPHNPPLQELGIVENYCSWRCIGGDPVAYYYQIIYYLCIILVLVLALVFAFQTRKVKIEVLNDSKWIAAIVYFSVPIAIIFFVFTFILASWNHLSGTIYCIGLFVLSTMFLGFVFVPKVSNLYL